jgi:urate oxidase
MALLSNTYGKGRVRVLRLHRDGQRHEVRELNVRAMMTGDFDVIYTEGDNAKVVSTDTVKNIVNVVARENLALETEPFCAAVCQRFLDLYPQIASMEVTAHETKWTRLMIDGALHPHGFMLDNNGRPFATVKATRQGSATVSGIAEFTFMKSTESGWSGYVKDSFTTLK